MLLHQLIKDIKNEIAKIGAENQYLPPFVRVEAEIILRDIDATLDDMKIPDDVEADAENLQPLLDLLAQRSTGIAGTAANYNRHPQSKANKACILIAEKLGKILNKNPIEILMPGLEKFKIDLSSLSHLVLADDNITPVDVVACLNAYAKEIEVYLNHAKRDPKNIPKLRQTFGDKKELSQTEINRVIYHSKEANDYYEAIDYYNKRNMTPNPGVFTSYESYLKNAIKENKLALSRKSTSDRKQQEHSENVLLLKYIAQLLDENSKTSLFKDKNDWLEIFEYIRNINDKNLFTSCLAHILPKIESRQQFINIFLTRDKQDWKNILVKIPSDQLSSILLERNSLVNAIQHIKKTDNEWHDRAVLFALTEAYWQERDKAEESTAVWALGFLGAYAQTVKYYVGGHTKEEKELTVKTFQDFLLNDKYKLDEFDKYVNELEDKTPQQKQTILASAQTSNFYFLYNQTKTMLIPTPKKWF